MNEPKHHASPPISHRWMKHRRTGIWHEMRWRTASGRASTCNGMRSEDGLPTPQPTDWNGEHRCINCMQAVEADERAESRLNSAGAPV